MQKKNIHIKIKNYKDQNCISGYIAFLKFKSSKFPKIIMKNTMWWIKYQIPIYIKWILKWIEGQIVTNTFSQIYFKEKLDNSHSHWTHKDL